MAVRLVGERIDRVLGQANELARRDGALLERDPSLADWRDNIAFLQLTTTPRTYLAVTAVLLTARALHDSKELDVRAIKAGTSARGFSASSIGSRLASFAKEQGIDLRAGSSQPMNNQPFTFKAYLSPTISVQEKFALQWRDFNSIVDQIDALGSSRAFQVLGLLFHLNRRAAAPTIRIEVSAGGKSLLDNTSEALARFVDANSDGGRVGQAFAAAVMDLIYPVEQVVLGDTQDPDASRPGDVHVTDDDGFWLWTEVKQKVVTTGDVQGFMRRVRAAGGERVVYFALVNSRYSGNIRPEAISSEARRLGIGISVVESPQDALKAFLPVATGSYAAVTSHLIERTHARMVQAGCAPNLLDEVTALARSVGAVRVT